MTLNHGWSYRERVGLAPAGERVLDYLAETHRHSTRQEWAERLQRGQVELDGRPADVNTVLRSGQTLVWHRPPWDEPDVPLDYEVVHEDDAIVAVAKPSGLPTMPAGGFLEHTLIALVRARYPGARPMHRLGRHTSGVVLFARTHDAAAVLARAWRDHAVEKHYRALGSGVAATDVFDIDAPIGPVPHPRLGFVHAASRSGKPSQSVATVLERRETSTVFDVAIITGRPHQVRIHLAYAGHPLVGDPLYAVGGVPRAEHPGLPGDGGYLLHAERLGFAHPVSRVWMEIRAVPPGWANGGQTPFATN